MKLLQGHESLEGPSKELTGSLYQNLTESAKFSTAPKRERSDTHKVPRRLQEPCQNSHHTTTRAIRRAQTAEKAA